jgi:hypothetical protein
MDEREEHPGKQPSERFLIEWGISIGWSFKHPKKQSFPIDSICD